MGAVHDPVRGKRGQVTPVHANRKGTLGCFSPLARDSEVYGERGPTFLDNFRIADHSSRISSVTPQMAVSKDATGKVSASTWHVRLPDTQLNTRLNRFGGSSATAGR